jgi:squalene-hopene/tetraprenyl-beta-curcumene cyclase
VATLAEDPSYPEYAPALAILVLSVPSNTRHLAARGRLVASLLARQLTEAHGWSPDDVSYGGWGYFRFPPLKPEPGAPVHELLSSNLSATLFAVGALALAEVSLDDPALLKALTFVKRCQNYPAPGDGGFFFTPANDLQNKALADPSGRFRSYGSMTADGVRALIRLGVPRHDPRVKAGAEWLRRRFDPEKASGDYPAGRETQRRSVYYYYVWTTAHARLTLGDAGWAEPLAAALLSRQRADGAWSNPATDLREDDPLLATPFAMAALAIARTSITGEWRTSGVLDNLGR